MKQFFLFAFLLFFTSDLSWAMNCCVCGDEVSDLQVADGDALECSFGHRIDRGCLSQQVDQASAQGVIGARGISCRGATAAGGSCRLKFGMAEVKSVLSPQASSRTLVRSHSSSRGFDGRVHFAPLPVGSTVSASESAKSESARGAMGSAESPTKGAVAGGDAFSFPSVVAPGMIPVLRSHPIYALLSDKMRAWGPLYEIAGVIWSSVIPDALIQDHAYRFCQDLGGGARLPTREEYFVLSRILGAKDPERGDFSGYNPLLFPGMEYAEDYFLESSVTGERYRPSWSRNFWTSSVSRESSRNGYVFNGRDGSLREMYRITMAVPFRCVRSVVPSTSELARAKAVLTKGVPVLEGHPRYHDLSEGFRTLGKAFEFGGLIWGMGSVSEGLTHSEARAFCESLGGGARLPTPKEWFSVSRAMGAADPENYDFLGYSSEDFPVWDADWDQLFWSDAVDPSESDSSFVWSGYYGVSESISSDTSLSGVVCVMDGVTAGAQ